MSPNGHGNPNPKALIFRCFEMRVVNLDDIHEDETFQRILNMAHVNNIVQNFFEPAVLALVCVELGGRLVCIDARHRLHALRRLGFKEWLVCVVRGLPVTDMFKLFCVLNGIGKLNLKPRDEFYFALKANYLREKTIWEVVVEEFKFHIPLRPQEPQQGNSVVAYKALQRLFDQQGREGLRRVFRVVTRCYLANQTTQQPQDKAVSYDFILGMGKFLANAPYTMKDIVARLKAVKTPASAIVDEGMARMRATGVNGHSSTIKHIGHTLSDIMQTDGWRQATSVPGAVDGEDDGE